MHSQPKIYALLPDMLCHICNFIPDIQVLGRMCKTSKAFSNYLLSKGAGRHWVCAGKKICGEEYWNDAAFDRVLAEDDGRYKTMLHVCPWRSIPCKFPMKTLKGHQLLDAQYDIVGMKLDDKREFYHDLSILVYVEDTGHVLNGFRVISVHSTEQCGDRDDVGPDAQEQHYEVRGSKCDEFLRKPSADEMKLLAELEDDRPFLEKLRIYGSGHLEDVQIVHKGMLAVIFYQGEHSRNILFISRHDRHKILWDANIEGGDAFGVLFSPGEMWFVTDHPELYYFGPDSDKQVACGFGGGSQFGLDGRIARAFCATLSGNVPLALSILEPLDLDLYTVHAPNTKLSLFDAAAYPHFQKPWKGTQALTSDAAMLLQMEPRFKTSIFMMQQAIYQVDNKRIRQIVADGLKFMPWTQLRDCCVRVDFEQACSVLRALGVTILASDGRKYLGNWKWKPSLGSD